MIKVDVLQDTLRMTQDEKGKEWFDGFREDPVFSA